MNLKNVERNEKNQVILEVEVSAEEFEAAVNRAYRSNVKRIALPGFRKGKAPRKMIELAYGKSFFWEDAVNDAYSGAYEAAVSEAGIEPVDQASVELAGDISEEGFTFKATVTVRPDAKIEGYRGIEAVRPLTEVSEAEVDGEIDRLRQRNARIQTADRPAKEGDTVLIDFEGFLDGVPFEGGKGENHRLELGSGSFIPGFEEQLIGVSAGDERDLNVSFPGEYHAENLAGKAVVFKVKTIEVKESILPDADDEFAKDVSEELNTLADLREDCKGKLSDAKKRASDEAFEESVLTQLADKVEAEIPDVMFENEISSIVDNFAYRLQMQGLQLDSYLQMTGMGLSDLRDVYRPQAERQIKLDLAFRKIIELEGLSVDEAELEEEYKLVAERYNMPADRVKTLLDEKTVRMEVLARKAAILVKDSAVAIAPSEEKEKPKKKTAAKAEEAKEKKSTPAKAAAKKKSEADESETKKPAAKKISTKAEPKGNKSGDSSPNKETAKKSAETEKKPRAKAKPAEKAE